MDSEIPPLIQGHKLRANQQFDKKEQKSTQVSAECLIPSCEQVSRAEKKHIFKVL